ncbi:MAG: serine/threonine protein kinase [Candidatus Bathyarchaeota archaeon]|nr:serine/threonine protein kinase [Candidatus Bathyarchaeota archaeon]
MQAGEVVSLKVLRERKHCKVLCYPRCEQEELEKRLKELERLGVKALEFTGKKSVFDVPVLGKGCVGIVVVAYTNSGRAALKIRRVDADRKGMFHEGEMLKIANAIDVGPKLLEISENFLLMELVEGTHFPEWIESLGEREVQSRVRWVLKDILEQCYRLDEAGLDHGELSNAPKHIIVDADARPYLVDFETASINRRVSNVTSVCQYIFLGSQIAEKVKDKLGKVDEKQLINALRAYKRERTRENFEKLLEKSRTWLDF